VVKESIRVEGDIRLSIKRIESAQIQTKGGVINLLKVFYVPDLGVNLLSGTAFCEKGLRDSFNKRALYIYNRKDSLILKTIK
jgi:hypothetical protein